MGFYGNITNTANTTFSFDIIYSTRESLDANCDTDGVFLGRYVLVDYDDQEVIKAYFIKDEDTGKGQFYNKPNPNLEGDKADKPLEPRLGVIYQALNITADTGDLMFYKWNQTAKQYQVITEADKANTPYVSNFRADVEKYGRGYDSTVWVKHYDPAKNKYQYVMVAELNAAVPTFHLVTDPPTPLPTTPYIDRDTTNLDYYLHQQSNYGLRVGSIKDAEGINIPVERDENNNPINRPKYSDEAIKRKTVTYTVNSSGYQDFNTDSEEDVWLDIFYNNKGFQEDIHTNITELKDEIGYSLSSSGRKYGNLPLPNSAITADDTLDWHIRLPGIGNAICRMWDRFYGNRADNKRYLNFAQKREDTESNLVTYDQNTVIGIINTARDMLGYYFLPISALSKAKDENKEIISKTDVLGEKAVSYTVPVALEYKKGNVSKDQFIDYPILKCLYYKPATEKEPIKYYHYVYTPTHDPIGADIDPEELDKTINYYYYDENTKIYHIANPEAYNYDNANNVKIKTVYYTRTDGWTLTEIEQGDNLFENSIYGLITEIHTLLGTDTKDTRDLNNLQGCINIIRDIVESLNLAPGKLLYTNAKGQIATSDTYFPSAKWDADEVLAGDGKWVSRFSQVTILKNSENANQDESKVNNIVNGVEDEDIVATVLISDNDKTNDGGTEIVQNNKHTANNLTFGTRNKWIKLYGDPEDDSLEFKHQESPIITRLRAEESTGSTYVKMHNTIQDDEGKENIKVTAHGNVDIYDATGYKNFSAVEDIENHIAEIKVEPTTDNLSYDSENPDANDNRLTIPYLTVDNAGHVVELGTKNFNIPHGFKKIETTAIEITDESVSSDKPGISIAESISDTLELAPKNRWINIATVVDNNEEGSATDNNAEDPRADKITFGHRLVPTLEENVALNGDRRTSGNEIPNVYRYGLPQDKSVSDLDEDFGGYDKNGNKIIDTTLIREAANTFNVPYIEVDMAGHVVAAETHTVKLPENYTTIKVSAESTYTGTGSTDGPEGETFDSLAGEKTLTAKTLTETLVFEPSNKWIRLNGTDTKGLDTITIGHEIHNIIATADREDLDVVTDTTNDTRTQKETFDTQIVRWDNAGHITGYKTKTWTLPDSFHNIVVGEASTATENGTSEKGILIADTTFDSFSITPSNKWIRLKGDPENDNIDIGHLVQNITTPTSTVYLSNGINYNTHEFSYDEAGHITEKKVVTYYLPEHIVGNKWIVIENTEKENKQKTVTYSHLTQGTAKAYGTDVVFNEFGGKVDLQGYETDEAGHVIAYPTYTLTLPKGSYVPDHDDEKHNGARVIIDIGFTSSSGIITSTSKSVGALTLMEYGNATTTISANSTINEAFAALDNRIDNLTIKINETSLKAITGKDVFTIGSNDGIVLNTNDTKYSFTINHKAGAVQSNSIENNKLYKFNLDSFGHISEIVAASAADIGLGNVENKNVAEILSSAALTGTPTAPTATLDTILDQDKIKQIATIEFVQEMIKDLREHYSVGSDDVLYLSMPSLTISQNNNPNGTITLTAIISDYSNSGNADQKEFAYQWFIDGVDTPIESKNSLIINNPISGTTYKCVLTRTHYGNTNRREKTITITV